MHRTNLNYEQMAELRIKRADKLGAVGIDIGQMPSGITS